jgi:hypothetical protein
MDIMNTGPPQFGGTINNEIDASLALCQGYLKHLRRQVEDSASDSVSQSILWRKAIIKEQIIHLNQPKISH